MTTLLIGHTGFLGGTLRRQRPFDEMVNRAHLDLIRGRRFSAVFCAGAPGQKWLANREPDADRANLQRLMDALATVHCERFVLLSTVDVFAAPHGVHEDSPVPEGATPYGRHRHELERFVAQTFAEALTVRLPGLIGPGLRKNLIYDLLHGRDLSSQDPRDAYQFYPVVNLWSDLQRLLEAGVPLAHLCAEPVSAAEVMAEAGRTPGAPTDPDAEPVTYDLRTRLGALWGSTSPYQYTRAESLTALRSYLQSGGLTGHWVAPDKTQVDRAQVDTATGPVTP